MSVWRRLAAGARWLKARPSFKRFGAVVTAMMLIRLVFDVHPPESYWLGLAALVVWVAVEALIVVRDRRAGSTVTGWPGGTGRGRRAGL